MTVFVVAWAVSLVGFYAGHAHARWIMRDELQGLAKRITRQLAVREVSVRCTSADQHKRGGDAA